MLRLRCAVAIVTIALFFGLIDDRSARAEATAPESIEQAIEARDQRHDFAAARALLQPIADAPLLDASSKDAAARAHYLLGDLDERALQYASALDHYRAVLTIDPGNWYAATARARVGTLERYQCCFDALATLDSVRRDASKANDVSAVDALAAGASSMPPPVRDEALLFVAEAYAGRLRQPEKAIAPALSLARDTTAPPLDRATAFEIAYASMGAIGAYDRIRMEILGDPAAPRALVTRARRALRRRALDGVSSSIGVVGVVAFLFGAVETIRRRRLAVALDALRSRAALWFLALLVGGGYVVAEQWQRGSGAPFVAFGAALLAVHFFVAAWRGGFGDRRRGLRALGGVLAAACVLAAAWRVLEHGGAKTTAMLDEVGL